MTTPAEVPLRLTIPDLAPVAGLDALDDIARAQLEVASRLYGGVSYTAEEVFAVTEDELDDGDRIAPDFLERGRVLDADGTHLYDLLFYNVDSGSFFAKGTTDVVAEIIQFGVHCSEKELEQALERAFRGRPKPAPGSGPTGSPLSAYRDAVEQAIGSADTDD